MLKACELVSKIGVPGYYLTYFDYTQRNRLKSVNSNGHTMELKYDGVGNKTKETRADNAFRSWEYDVPNRITRAIDWRMSTAEPAVTTTYGRNVTSTIETITDSKLAVYTFGFDALHRKISETYPIDATGEARTAHWWYDAAGNVRLYKNPGNQYKHLDHADSYDSRNRLRHSSWNASASSVTRDLSVGQEITIDYDAASRMTQIRTNDGETTVSFGYDNANRKVREYQTLAGYLTRQVNTPRDADGNRASLDVANYYHVDYGYTYRNQLASVNGFATFSYDPSGNLTNRTATWVYNSGTNYYYDELNRATQIEHGDGQVFFARSHYQYDQAGREVATWRDEESSKGERFSYNARSQLSNAKYNADQVWTGSPLNASRNMTYDLSPLNRQSVVSDNGFSEGYANNGMNQYTSVGGVPVGYDGNFNLTNFNGGLTFHYDAENHLVSGSMQATYDGLGRCVRRTVGGITRLFTYDDWKPMLEWDGAGNWTAWNIYGAGPDEILARYDVWDRASIYKQDQHGNVVAVLNQYRGLSEKYRYDAFGKPTILSANNTQLSASAIGNRFMFTGREYIQELSIYDYRHRMYMPDIGRFLQMDPLGLQTEGEKLSAGQKGLFSPGGVAPEAFSSSEMNLFRYCGDDPVDGSDPFGLDAEFTLMRDPFVTGQNANPRLSAGIMTITENGKFMGAMRVNANGFYPDRQGIPAGNYVVLPKAKDGSFPKGTPAVTSPSMRDKPGATTAGHPEGAVLIHGEGKPGEPDSKACITAGPAGLKLATDVFNRNKDSTTMKVYNGPATTKPNEIPRAIPLDKRYR